MRRLNYREISIQSIAKLFESLVTNTLVLHFINYICLQANMLILKKVRLTLMY